jgi:hypothetical protein
MTIVRGLLVLGALGLAGLILWAIPKADLITSFLEIGAMPWGVVTFVDLYLGFALAAIVVALTERRLAVSVPLILLTLVLGNVVMALWFAIRLPVLIQRLRG